MLDMFAFRSLAKHLQEERESILAGSNLTSAFRSFLGDEGKQGEAVARSLLTRLASSEAEWPVFARLESFVCCLEGPSEVSVLAELGLAALKSEDKKAAGLSSPKTDK